MKKKKNENKYYALTHAQKRILYDDKLFPGTSVSTQAFIVKYKLIIDKDILESAINKLIIKNDGIRLHFVEQESSVSTMQYVSPYCYYTLESIDFSNENNEIKFQNWIEHTTQTPFQLLESNLFHFTYVKFSEKESGYYMKMHHAISDGWCYPKIFAEINRFYEKLIFGKSIDEKPAPSYIQYIKDELEYLNSKQVEIDKDFWHKAMIPLPEPVSLTRQNSDLVDSMGKAYVVSLSPEMCNNIDEFCKLNKTSIFKLLLSSLSIFATTISGLDEVSIGTANHNRFEEGRQEILGMFVSTIPIRVSVDGNMTLKDFIYKNGQMINYTLKNHQQYPFNRLATELREITGEDTRYLVDLFISGHGDVEEVDYKFKHIFQGYVSVPFSIHINYNNKHKTEKIIELEYEYQLANYSDQDVLLIHQGIVNILNEIFSNPAKKISEIDFLPQNERQKIIFDFNNTEKKYCKDKTIHKLFEDQVSRDPKRQAVSGKCFTNSISNALLTYQELNTKANQLAYCLKTKGIQNEDIVTIMVEPSIEMIIGVLGILKAGGAFLPIKDQTPAERINYIMEDSSSKLLVTREKLIEGLNYVGGIILVDDENVYCGTNENLDSINSPSNLSYVIYTSGSTGKPKGVMIEHGSLVNLCFWHNNYFSVTANDRATKYAGFGFDASVWEIFPYLIIGATLFIVPEEIKLDINSLNSFFEDNGITIAFLPTQVCEQFMNTKNHSLRVLLTGGDKLKTFKEKEFKVYNNYGPSENTVVTTCFEVKKFDTNIPIGKPLFNNQVYILNKYDKLQHIRIPGELCIGGDSLSRGYLNKPELTNEKFIKNPFHDNNQSNSSSILYRTGDLARWLPDGNIEFMGRNDFQVKIRGFRIELGEIEHQLLLVEDIKEVVVIAREDIPGDKYLCAYFVSEEKVDVELVKITVSKELPDYMVPASFVQIESMPLTQNGKIDQKALAKIDVGYGKIPYMHKKAMNEAARFMIEIQKEYDYFEARVLEEDPELVIKMEDPAPGKFGCFIIGDSNLLIKCAEVILRHGHKIYGIVSENLHVIDWAKENDILFIRPKPDYISAFLELKPFDYLFCVDNRMEIKEDILPLPRNSILNYHKSYLPRYLGYNPNSWAIIDIQKKHGITWHIIGEGGYLGDIVKQVKLDIDTNETVVTLDKKCANACIKALEELIIDINYGRLQRKKQNTKGLTYSPKYKRLESGGLVSFEKEAFEISAFMRGLNFRDKNNPIGMPRLSIGNDFFLLKDIFILDSVSGFPPGTVVKISTNSITITTSSNDIKIKEIFTTCGNSIKINDFITAKSLKEGFKFDFDFETARRIEILDSKICRHENFWVKRLLHLNPLILNNCIPEQSQATDSFIQEKKFFIPVDINTFEVRIPRSEILLTAFVAYLSHITGITSFNIGYSSSSIQRKHNGLENIFAITLPLHIKSNPKFSFKAFLTKIHDEIKTLKKNKTYIRDIRVRYPQLHYFPDESFAVGITMVNSLHNIEEIKTTLYRQLNLVIPLEGNACMVLYNPALIDEKIVHNIFHNFLDFLHTVISNRDTSFSNLVPKSVKVSGKIEFKLKIKNSIIDLETIENCLLEFEDIKKAAVVLNMSKSGKQSLCAFLVSDKTLNESSIKEFLLSKLPPQIMPAHFIQLDEMPLTENSEINKQLLSSVELKTGTGYEAPRNETEEKLAEIFHDVLGMDKSKISITESFFRLGGHSLKAAVLITKIHKEFNIKISISKIFESPSIKQLSTYINDAAEEKYISIKSAKKKDYYLQTSAQKRLFFFDQLEKGSTLYNIPLMDIYHLGTDKNKLENAFREMIKRHESLRTSFSIKDGEAVQFIHEFEEVGAEFEIEYYETKADGMIFSKQQGKEWTRITGMPFQDIVEHFVQPFDLQKPPLLRAGIINIAGAIQILMLDMHHIITDGVSMIIFLKELWELYEGKQLPSLRIQYKDFAEWSNSSEQKIEIKKQEKYWLKEFEGEIPLLNLPTDFQRPAKMTFDGNIYSFEINKEETRKLKFMSQRQGETLYMVLLATFYVLLAKLSGQEEIIIGTVTAGRGHADLQPLLGMFVDTLALRNYPEDKKTFKQFLSEVKKQTLGAFENQDYPFEELVSKVASRQDPSRNPLFDVTFGLENEADQDYLLDILMMDKSNPYSFNIRQSKFDLSLDGAETGDGLKFTIEYNTNLFKEETIERFGKYFKNITSSLCNNVNQKISDIEITTESEKIKILYEFNDFSNIRIAGDDRKTLHQLFEEMVQKKPENIAITGPRMAESKKAIIKFSYRQLNNEANRLAVKLREYGTGPDHIVGIITHPSIEMFVGMLGIMKAGGAYVPLDPTHPNERTDFILKDSNTDILLYSQKLADDINFDGHKLNLEAFALDSEDEYPDIEITCEPRNLVYVIYTSGTTGKPKGVMTEHRNVVAYLEAFYNQFNIKESDSVLQQASYTFDVFVEEVYPILMKGGNIAIPENKNIIVDMQLLANFVSKHNVNIIDCTPLLLNEINKAARYDPDPWLSVHTFISGGDVLKPSYVDTLVKIGSIYNTYGPTESTVCVTYYKYTKDDVNAGMSSIPIGNPISGYQAYILDKNKKLQPIGISGELCAGGRGISRGYLNRPALTNEKFIENPFFEGERLYRTGDLVRWLPDGNIEFAGRIDHQVKIRGYRIELEEIETRLQEHPAIDEAVVVALELPTGTGLSAYYISNKEIDARELRDYMDKHLPPYMIPSYFVQLEKFPETSTGKVDRKALPNPSIGIISDLYEAPRTTIEKKLVETWQEVLEIEQVGIEDDFFILGGDSIKAMQIVSKLQIKKLRVDVSQMFSQRNIKKLSKYVKPLKVTRQISQDPVQGEVELTPIQRWLFKNHFNHCRHFNQALMIYKLGGFKRSDVEKAFSKILFHHDALRMKYRFDGKNITQLNEGHETSLFDMEVMQWDQKPNDKVLEEIEWVANRLQRSIDLENGPLVKLCLFKENEGDHLLVVIHHLVVDGVCWRILLEDFETAYVQSTENSPITLPEKTDSFQFWAQKQREFAESNRFLMQILYWNAIEETKTQTIPIDNQITEDKRKYKYNETISIELEREKTSLLLTAVNRAFNTEINDILLTALGLTINQWCGHEKVLIDLEGHGRENIVEDININRTIGWFTTQYPVILDISHSIDLGYTIKNVKEIIRRIPYKGIGYGILKYLTPSYKKNNVQFNKAPEILFNYLGQFSQEKSTFIDEVSGITELGGIGDNISPDMNFDHKIDIEGIISSKGKLHMTFIYNSFEYKKSTIQKLADQYFQNLERIINYCLSVEMSQLTPSDVGCNTVSLEIFENIIQNIKKNIRKENVLIKSMFSLTAMQESLLKSTLENNEAYFVQIVFAIPSSANKTILKKSFNLLIEKHEIFRTLYFNDKQISPLQFVVEKAEFCLNIIDISSLPDKDKQHRIDDYMKIDKRNGFDLTSQFATRASLFITGDEYDKLIWSIHNIYFDGWSMGIFLKDFCTIYETLESNHQVSFSNFYSYKDYVLWIQQQNLVEGLNYWKEYLDGYQSQPVLSALGRTLDGMEYQLKNYQFIIDEILYDGLSRVASANASTLNSLFQSIWGFMLQKYTGKNDILFGAIVSGRAVDVKGIDNIVGLFTNIVPIRIKSKDSLTFSELLNEVQLHSTCWKKYEFYPLSTVLENVNLADDSIDNLLFFQSYPIDGERNVFYGQKKEFKMILEEGSERLGHGFNLYIVPDRPMIIKFGYNSLLYNDDLVKRTELNLKNISQQIVDNPHILLKNIEIE